MRYERYMYITPSRPEKPIPVDHIDFYEKRGWWAQAKKNGTNHHIYISPEKKIISMGRHNNKLIEWKWDKPEKAERFLTLPGKGWYVINTEVMYKKSLSRGVNYIHDIYVDDGKFLVGTTYAQRYAILQKLFFKDVIGSTEHYHVLNEHTWLARNLKGNFAEKFAAMTSEEDEGLVLKDPRGILQATGNAPWTVKSRRKIENADF